MASESHSSLAVFIKDYIKNLRADKKIRVCSYKHEPGVYMSKLKVTDSKK